MNVRKPTIALALAVVAGLFVGCGDDDDGQATSDTTQNDVGQVAEDVREGAENVASEAAQKLRTGWASLRTNSERLVDEIKTRNDSEAKQQLLDECRDRLQDAREADSDQVERIESVCDRIRDTDVNAGDTWDSIRKEIDDIDVG
jgi:hypothetical protein